VNFKKWTADITKKITIRNYNNIQDKADVMVDNSVWLIDNAFMITFLHQKVMEQSVNIYQLTREILRGRMQSTMFTILLE